MMKNISVRKREYNILSTFASSQRSICFKKKKNRDLRDRIFWAEISFINLWEKYWARKNTTLISILLLQVFLKYANQSFHLVWSILIKFMIVCKASSMIKPKLINLLLYRESKKLWKIINVLLNSRKDGNFDLHFFTSVMKCDEGKEIEFTIFYWRLKYLRFIDVEFTKLLIDNTIIFLYKSLWNQFIDL